MAELGVDHHALQELEHLTTSFGQLKQAQAKFKSCVDDTTEIDPRNTSSSPCCLLPPPPPHPLNPNSLPTFVQRDESNPAGFFADQPILIPLTSSLYVPGKLTDLENVVVDVGTGYYVQKVRLSGCVAACLCFAPIRALVRAATRETRDRTRLHRDPDFASRNVLQTRKEALKHYTAKTAFVRSNLETLQSTIEKKQDNL